MLQRFLCLPISFVTFFLRWQIYSCMQVKNVLDNHLQCFYIIRALQLNIARVVASPPCKECSDVLDRGNPLPYRLSLTAML